MTTDKAPDCSGCRFLTRPEFCACLEFEETHPAAARRTYGDCGPAGRNYEPREEK